jgi:outer membrane protein assembly factor BamA
MLTAGTPLCAQFADYGNGSESDKLKGKKVKFTGVPYIGYNKSVDMIFGAVPMAVYRFNGSDTLSPPGTTLLGGLITTNKTWGVLMANQWYVQKDQYRFTLGYLYGSLNFQTYLSILPSTGKFIDFNTSGHLLFTEAQREVYKKFYLGLNFLFTRVNTEFDIDLPIDQEKILTNYNALGTVASYDKRDNRFTPSKGIYTTLRPLFFRTWLGSKNDFSTISFDFNFYHSFKRNPYHVLTGRLTTDIAAGDVPFEYQIVLGGDDIRGYTNGKYRDRQVYTMQAEWRWNFYKRLGMVAFAGMGLVTDSARELGKNGALPGGGIGFRFLALKDDRISIGLDAAMGKKDWGIYFRIGEAF